MTPGERAIWVALYAASWHQPSGSATGVMAGVVADDDRARWCAQQANRGLAALKQIADPAARLLACDMAIEVLR
jgi:hypothetical protein